MKTNLLKLKNNNTFYNYKMFDKLVYYAFILGLILGRMTNIIGVLILSTIVIFFIDPGYYSYENFVYLKNLTHTLQFKLPVYN